LLLILAHIHWQSAVQTATSGLGYSPNGKYLLYASNTGTTAVGLVVLNATTGVTLYQATGNLAGWGFSPDDDRLLLTSIDNGVSTATLLDLSSASTPQRGQGADTTSSSYVGFSPNGTYLLDAALAGTNTTNLKRL